MGGRARVLARAGRPSDALRDAGGEPLVIQLDGDVIAESLGEPRRERARLARLSAVGAAERQRQADYHALHDALGDQLPDRGKPPAGGSKATTFELPAERRVGVLRGQARSSEGSSDLAAVKAEVHS